VASRRYQFGALSLGTVFAVLGVYTLVNATAVGGFLAGALLLGISLPCFAVAGMVALGRYAGEAIAQSKVESVQARLLKVLEGREAVAYDVMRDALELPDEELAPALEALVAERRASEDFDEERGAYVYTLREPSALDPEAPLTQDVPEQFLSVSERARRARGRERA
jgi:hypothetical protein